MRELINKTGGYGRNDNRGRSAGTLNRALLHGCRSAPAQIWLGGARKQINQFIGGGSIGVGTDQCGPVGAPLSETHCVA
jgi:hypothetical protein